MVKGQSENEREGLKRQRPSIYVVVGVWWVLHSWLTGRFDGLEMVLAARLGRVDGVVAGPGWLANLGG